MTRFVLATVIVQIAHIKFGKGFFFIATNKIISLSENVSRMQNILVCFSSTLEHRLNKWSTIHPNRIDAQMKCLKAVCYNWRWLNLKSLFN